MCLSFKSFASKRAAKQPGALQQQYYFYQHARVFVCKHRIEIFPKIFKYSVESVDIYCCNLTDNRQQAGRGGYPKKWNNNDNQRTYCMTCITAAL